jgi:2-keto-4-pentenoate hydratase/2-oxohepta-3-ene-1,7-dioic acid hydratase in catechol pathway
LLPFNTTASGVGLVSDDLLRLEPFDLPEAQERLGALPIVESQVRGDALPRRLPAIAMADVKVIAPLPRPRRNIFCVGKNYHAHAKEFACSGFDSSAKSGGDIPAHPIIFTKVPESVVGPYATVEMPAVLSCQRG